MKWNDIYEYLEWRVDNFRNYSFIRRFMAKRCLFISFAVNSNIFLSEHDGTRDTQIHKEENENVYFNLFTLILWFCPMHICT